VAGIYNWLIEGRSKIFPLPAPAGQYSETAKIINFAARLLSVRSVRGIYAIIDANYAPHCKDCQAIKNAADFWIRRSVHMI
jgi:hypothetical protein